MSEKQLRQFQMWNFTRFQNHLLSTGKVNDTNWLDNYFRPELKKAMMHLSRIMQDRLVKRNNMYHLIGMDFMLDNNLKLWFIEGNVNPSTQATSKERKKFMVKMLKDHYELMYAYLKSRMRRVINFVNQLIMELPPQGILVTGLRDMGGYSEIKRQFDKINTNYLDGSEKVKASNEFMKIVDENFEGTERYQGLLTQECI